MRFHEDQKLKEDKEDIFHVYKKKIKSNSHEGPTCRSDLSKVVRREEICTHAMKMKKKPKNRDKI